MGLLTQIKACVPPDLAETAKADLLALCGGQVSQKREKSTDGEPCLMLEGVVTDASHLDLTPFQTKWDQQLQGRGEHLGVSFWELMKCYLYRIEIYRGESIYKQGVHLSMDLEPRQVGYHNDKYYDMEVKFLCIFYTHTWSSGGVQLLPDGEWYGSDVFDSEAPTFLVKEAAVLLNLSEQRILQFLSPHGKNPPLLTGKKRGKIWLISGKELVAFASKERPAGRPSTATKHPTLRTEHTC